MRGTLGHGLCVNPSLVTSHPRATFGLVEGFMRPSLGCRCSKSILHTDNFSLFWYFWIWQFWCRWSSVPLYHVCCHCSWDSNALSTLS